MCGWDIVECEDAVAELEEEVCAEGDEGPEGKLQGRIFSLIGSRRNSIVAAKDWYDAKVMGGISGLSLAASLAGGKGMGM